MRALLLLASLAWSVPALACSPPLHAEIFVAPKIGVGGVVGFGTCLSDCSQAQVVAADAAGNVVPGERLGDERLMYWKPMQPLEVGRSYSLTVTQLESYPVGGTFEVVSRVDPFDDGVQSTFLSVGTTTVDGASVCCPPPPYSPPPPGACTYSPQYRCMTTRRGGQVKVGVTLIDAKDKSSQWKFVATISEGEVEHSFALTASNSFGSSTQGSVTQGRYCARIDALAIGGEERVRGMEVCRDVDLTLPAAFEATEADVAAFEASCEARDAGVRDAGARDAGVRDAARDARQERDASALDGEDREASAGGCQLGDDHAGTLTTVFILLGLAASGSRRTGRMRRRPKDP